MGWLLAGAGLVLAIALTVATIARRERVPARSVLRAIAAGRFEKARAEITRWVESDPDSSEPRFLQARLLFATGRPSEALAALDHAARLGHDPVEVDRLRGFVLVLQGRYPEAEPLLESVVARRPDVTDVELDEALARVYLQTYQLRKAEAALKRWAIDAPRDARPHLWMTEVDRRTDAGALVTAAHYAAALERDPSLDDARLGLADALREGLKQEEALAEYRNYQQRKPKDAAGYVGAGRCELDLLRYDEAAASFDAALRLEPANLVALRERAGLHIRNNAFDRALPLLERAVEIDPLDTETMYRLGIVLARLGRNQEAEAVQERTKRLREDVAEVDDLRFKLKAQPRNNDLRCQIARWLLDHGQHEEGLKWARTILQAQPDHEATNRLLADYHASRGEAGLANYYRLQLASSPGATTPSDAAPK